MKKVLLFFTMLMVSVVTAFGQEQTVSGKVTGEDGSPIPFATVKIKGTSNGTTTNEQGLFSLQAPPGAVLTVSYVGYTSKDVPISGQSTVNVTLEASTSALNELVVVAYGQQVQRQMTGAVQQVAGKEVENVPIVSIDEALQGKVAGLQVVSVSGQPGANVDVRLRGIGSFLASSSPLWVIDGVPVNTGDLSRNTPTSNALAGLNPNDIESISVLKDASATSIYGSRAANGVIIITTKKGKAGKTKIRLDAEYGVNSVALTQTAKPLNTTQWLDLTTEGLLNNPSGAESDFGLPDGYISDYATARDIAGLLMGDTTINTNWLDVVTRNGLQQQYNISASGGDEKTTFFLSGGYFKQEGAVIGANFTRYSGNISLKHKLSNKINVGVDLNISNSIQHGPTTGGAFRNPMGAAYFLLPNMSPYDENGKPDTSQDIFYSTYNPLAILEYDRDHYGLLKMLGSAYGDYTIIDGLKFSTRFGVDYNYLEESSYYNPFFGDAEDKGGAGYANITRVFNWVWTNTLNYQHSLGKAATIDALVGYESQLSKNYMVDLESDNFPLTDQLNVLAVGSKPTMAVTNGADYAVVSLFSRVNVHILDKYSISGSFRRDGSSRFGTDDRYGSFYSVGAAWNVDQEDFMKNSAISNTISTLKIRVSYGVNGNAGIGNYQWRSLYEYDLAYNQRPGSAPSTVGNIALTWERNKPLDIGADIGLLKDRINVSFDWYNRKTDKLLQNLPLSLTTGFPLGYTANAGSLQNEGVELAVNATPIDQEFKWDVGLNIAFNKNKILELPEHKAYVNPTNTVFYEQEGHDIQSWYVRQYAGVDEQTGDALWYTDGTKSNTTNDYSSALRVIYGSASPKGFGSFTNTFSYKNIALTAQFNYQWGNYVSDDWASYLQGDGFDPFDNKLTSQLRRWQKPGDKTDVPKYVYNNPSLSSYFSTRFLYKGDYIRLRNVELSYELKPEWIHKLYMSSLRVYAKGTNLWTWVADKNLNGDPDEVGIAGSLDLVVPTIKTISFGINLGF